MQSGPLPLKGLDFLLNGFQFLLRLRLTHRQFSGLLPCGKQHPTFGPKGRQRVVQGQLFLLQPIDLPFELLLLLGQRFGLAA